MGIVRAAVGAVGGTLADSWLEFIEAGDMGPTTVMTKGVQVTRGKRGSNSKGTPDMQNQSYGPLNMTPWRSHRR